MTKIEWCDYRKTDSRIDSGNYILVYCPGHPCAKGKGHIFEHRYIMEKHIKRFLNTNEHIHHKNGNGKDNRIKNLEIVNSSVHARMHLTEKRIKVGVKALKKYSQKIKLPRIEVECACGCGGKLINRDSKGRLRKYKHGHNPRGRHWKWGKSNE